MNILNTLSLECNKQIKINFNGGDLSSDAGLLLIKEFASKIGFTKLINKKFKTNDKAVRFHKDDENLMQFDNIDRYLRDIIYTIKRPEHMLLDLDSTLFETYGNQEDSGYNFHYRACGI